MKKNLLYIFLSINSVCHAQICPDNNHPHIIDLGLPSGTRWACCNMDASKPTDEGGYYAWGETFVKDVYDWSSYSLCEGNSSTCEKLDNISGSINDVAYVKWGRGWHMPSSRQFAELVQMCSVSYMKIDNVAGNMVVGPNGNCIFFPLSGRKIGKDVAYYGYSGDLWGNASSQDIAGVLAQSYNEIYLTTTNRCEGLNVRAVMDGVPTYKTAKDIIKENGFKSSVSPLLTTQWTKWGAENSLLPFVDENKTEHAATGCGVTALGQILKFWQYPTHGIGENYYAWKNSYEVDPVILYTDYSNSYYDWQNMISVYENNNTVSQKRSDAVGKLMYDIAVALEVKLAGGAGGGTQIEYIHTVLKRFFGYNPHMQLLRQKNQGLNEMLKLIYNELSEGRPVLMGGTCNGANHIFIADGYDEEGLVHLNLGHANRKGEDKFYNLAEHGQTYTENIRMIIGISPQEIQSPITSVQVSSPGKLLDDLGGLSNAQRVTRIKITGTINATDIALLGQLSQTTTGQLSYIDLSDCTIENNVLPAKAFATGDEYNYTLQKIILPEGLKEIGDNAFLECRGLYDVNLPSTLTRIGNYAFQDCRYLRELFIPKGLSKMGSNPFIYDKLSKLTIEEGNAYYVIKNDAIISKDGTTFIALPLMPQGDYIIPQGVRRVNIAAISEGFRLNSISFPATITSLNSKTFYGYTTLTDMYFYSENAPMAFTTDNVKKCIIHVPYGCKEEYAQKGWDKFAAIIDDCDVESNNVVSLPTENKGQEDDLYSLQGIKIKGNNKGGVIVKKGKKFVTK